MKRFSRRGGFYNVSLPYRSGLEDRIAEQLEHAHIPLKYEKYSLKYKIPESTHTYTPDFVLPNGIIIEAKGIFDVKDRQKHLLIKKQYPDLDIRFVFSSSSTKIYPGAKTTVGQWATKNGFKWATKEIPLKWLSEPKRDMVGLKVK